MATADHAGHRSRVPADVVYAERDLPVAPTSNDPQFANEWGLNNIGQTVWTVGTPDADIDAPEAWNTTRGAGATVAVVDTGVETMHPDLAGQWTGNPGERGGGKETNGVDDDHNGYVDDWQGRDFVNNDNTQESEGNFHGTHVSGTIAALADNGIGVAGVAPQAKVLPVKIFGAPSSLASSVVIAQAFDYAGNLGVDVVNASLGGLGTSQLVTDVINAHPNTLYVVSAGNSTDDAAKYMPCNSPAANLVCVASNDNQELRSSFSNVSATAVDVFAPGSYIVSTTIGGSYTYANGTSMAAPHVSGAAALLAAEEPIATVAQMKAALLGSVDVKAGTRSFDLTRRQNGKTLPAGKYTLTLSTGASSQRVLHREVARRSRRRSRHDCGSGARRRAVHADPVAPHRPMTSARTLAVALAAVVCGVGVALVALSSDRVGSNVAWAIAGPLVGWSAVGTGLYTWRRRPENRTGLLMVLLGFAWFNSTLANADNAFVHQYAGITGGLWGAVFLHLGIAFPEGRVRPGLDRALVVGGYVIFPLAFLPGRVVGGVLYGVLFVLVVVRSARHWKAAHDFERLQLTPVYTFALLTFALVTIAQTADSESAWWGAFITTGLMPFAFIVGLTRSRISHLDAELHERMEELRASRSRVVAAGDAARRRLERDLHDGAQSRLVALALTLRMARNRAGDDQELAALPDRAQDELMTSLAELRELARGIHPAVLTERGLEAAVQSLVQRAPVPVTVEADCAGRLPGPVESAAYFVVSEGLANVAKYAHATQASVAVRREEDRVTIEVADDGVGGADTANGSGLRGLADRVAALDGTLTLESPAGRGTQLRAEIPVA